MKKIFIIFILSFIGLFFTQKTYAVTRFYLSNAAEDKTLPSVSGTWTNSTSTLTRLLGTKSGIATTQGLTASGTNANNMIARWQSLPLAADTSFATSDTVQYVIGAKTSSATSTTMHFRVHIFIVESDGSTVRGILLNNFTGTGAAWTTTATGRTDSTQALSNNISAKAGDRIVVEIGFNRTGTNTGSRTGTFNYGNTGATDLTSGSTSVTTQPGWLEFSNTFTTTTGAAPTITTQSVSTITDTTATGNGTVTLDNGFPITERGVVWNTTGSPTTADSKATAAGTTGSFTASMTGLTGGTLYHVRAYAINSQGTSYGNEVTFTTAIVSVSITSDGSISYGIVALNSSKDTTASGVNDTQTVQNNGTIAEDFAISGQNTACPWTLAGTNGADQYMHSFSVNSGTSWTALATSNQSLATNIASNGTQSFDLKITMPTSTSCYTQQSVDVTVTATAH